MNLTATSGAARMGLPPHLVAQTVGGVEATHTDLSILLIQRGNLLLPRPAADTVLREGDTVLVAGLDAAIDAFADS